MQETLFNPPIWMPIALGLVGIVVFLYGNARVQARVRNTGLGVLGLVLAWCVSAYLVTTPVEQCLNRSKALVAAAESGQWDTFKSLLDNTTTIERISARGRDAVTETVRGSADGYGLKNVRTLNTDVSTGVGTYDVTISVLLEGSQATTARFRFEYEQRSDGILLSKLVPISVGNMSVDDITNYIRNKAGMFGR